MAAATFIATSLLLAGLILLGTAKACDRLAMTPEERRRFTARATQILLAWMAFVAFAAGFGLFRAFVPILIAAVVISAVAFTRSPVGRLLETLPYSWLVGFHGFRVLAEVGLYFAYEEGRIPILLTFAGGNFDMVSGVSALVLGPILAKKPKKATVWPWNVVATILLATIVAMHALTGQTYMTRLPYVLLPGVLVWAAVAGHMIIFQKLLARDKSSGRAALPWIGEEHEARTRTRAHLLSGGARQQHRALVRLAAHRHGSGDQREKPVPRDFHGFAGAPELGVARLDPGAPVAQRQRPQPFMIPHHEIDRVPVARRPYGVVDLATDAHEFDEVFRVHVNQHRGGLGLRRRDSFQVAEKGHFADEFTRSNGLHQRLLMRAAFQNVHFA
jgi:hypothetical protein